MTGNEPRRHVWVIRHGATVGNRGGIHQGWVDYTLDQDGADECRRAREQFWGHLRVDQVVASPLRRTRDTAVALFGRVDRLDPLWAEVAIPGYEGLTYSQAHAKWPHDVRDDGWVNLRQAAQTSSPHPRAVPPHETGQDFLERVAFALDRAAKRTRPGQISAVVTHGAAVVAVLDLFGDVRGHVDNLTGVLVTYPADGSATAGELHGRLDAIRATGEGSHRA